MRRNNFSKFLLISVACLSFSACETNDARDDGRVVTSKNMPAIERDFTSISTDPFVSSMLSAAYEAEEKGLDQEAAIFLAKAYDRESSNEELAWRYARLLRLNNRAEQSVKLLTPYSVREKVGTDILREYVAALLSSGDIEQAYINSSQLTKVKDKNARIYNILGVVADANGFHDEAIDHFNQGLDVVAKNDEVTRAMLLNNLALAQSQVGDSGAAVTSIKQALTGAQQYPQIRDNFEAIKGFSDQTQATDLTSAQGEDSDQIDGQATQMEPIQDVQDFSQKDNVPPRPDMKPIID